MTKEWRSSPPPFRMVTRLPCGVPVSHHVSAALACGTQLCVMSSSTLASHRPTRLSMQHGAGQLISHWRSLQAGHQARHLSVAAATQGRLPRGGWVPQLPPHPLQPPRDSLPEPAPPPPPQPQRRRPPLQRMTTTPQHATQAPPSPHQQPQPQPSETATPQHAQEHRWRHGAYETPCCLQLQMITGLTTYSHFFLQLGSSSTVNAVHDTDRRRRACRLRRCGRPCSRCAGRGWTT